MNDPVIEFQYLWEKQSFWRTANAKLPYLDRLKYYKITKHLLSPDLIFFAVFLSFIARTLHIMYLRSAPIYYNTLCSGIYIKKKKHEGKKHVVFDNAISYVSLFRKNNIFFDVFFLYHKSHHTYVQTRRY